MATTATTAAYTAADLICVCISRQVEDGDVLAQGIATPLVAAGYQLARLTHAPLVAFLWAIGNSYGLATGPLGLTRTEDLTVGQALSFFSFGHAACEVLPALRPKEFFRPAQVDRFGQTNNVAVGGYDHPRPRLPGSGGIADVSIYHPRAYLYVPRHERSVFVERLGFVSGLGIPTARRPGDRPGPRLLISNLGTFDFAEGAMRLVSIHPGATLAEIEARTAFPLVVAPQLHETPPPSAAELALLREVIDPLGIRELEGMPRAKRWQRMREIARAEKATGEVDKHSTMVYDIDHQEKTRRHKYDDHTQVRRSLHD